ncbi:hypothetical protein AB1Y20_004642 [Prymnesium parvum]|uniref:J domain-containing protein n=1 Tax=Prymnesium parvum TaxID=97485 RepID=A0AB34IYZ1_PRYPA
MADPFEVLGVPKNATPEEVKLKYRSLALKHHPDLNKNNAAAAEKFNRINDAYNAAMQASVQEPWRQSTRGGGRAPRPGARPPREPSGPIHRSRFNVHEWERMHYGMHGGPGQERRDSEFLRHAWRQRGPSAARHTTGPGHAGGRAHRAAAQPAQRGGSLGGFLVTAFSVMAVWGMCFQSVQNHSGVRRR